MGKLMSKIAKRYARNYNVENRAQKVIEMHKSEPKPAPKYESSKREVQMLKKNFPSAFAGADNEKKDDSLLERLKQVKIESHGPPPEIKASSRPLPDDRRQYDRGETGVNVPEFIPAGKLSLQQALDLLIENQTNKPSKDDMCKKYKIETQQVESLLEYFRPFNVYIPKKGTADNETGLKVLSGLKLLGSNSDGNEPKG